MLESRSEDALVLLVKIYSTVETAETVDTAETVETVETAQSEETVLTEDLKKSNHSLTHLPTA